MAEPQFGGPWTEEKLSRLRKYLRAYMTIFSTHPQAKLLKTVYVDAFAGAGSRKDAAAQTEEANLLFDVTADSDAEALRKGSTRIALETKPAFSQYILSRITRSMSGIFPASDKSSRSLGNVLISSRKTRILIC